MSVSKVVKKNALSFSPIEDGMKDFLLYGVFLTTVDKILGGILFILGRLRRMKKILCILIMILFCVGCAGYIGPGSSSFPCVYVGPGSK